MPRCRKLVPSDETDGISDRNLSDARQAHPLVPRSCREGEGVMECPTCGGELRAVTYDRDSMLNSEQFDAVRAGDFYCKICKSTDARSGYKYWWKEDLQPKAPK